MRMRARVSRSLGLFALAAALAGAGASRALAQQAAPTNPYERIAWDTVSHHRADLHVHTIQSDGCHHVAEVVRAFSAAGFSILSITDHDAMQPHASCPPREAARPEDIAAGFFTETRSPAPDPQPANYPADPTWPWSEFGAPSPAELGIVGIEGAELTCGHHINSFFNDYGVKPPCRDAPAINEWLHEVARRRGLAFINHPEPRFREWYRELYRYHSREHLVGLELSSDVEQATVLWDQLLSDLMPSRTVWGFATSDVHFLVQTRFAFTVFLLDEPTTDGVKEAMQAGRFYAVVGPGMMDIRKAGRAAYEGTYPELRSISVDADAGQISIEATGYDEIVWISKPASGRMSIDPQRGVAWPPGQIVQRGPVFDYASAEAEAPYVRAELRRNTENGPVRVLLNPFALPPP
jgi:hypothetical protein